MLVLLGVRPYLLHFGCSDILWIDAADPHALTVHLQHDLGRPFAAQEEEFLQNENDEIHGGIVVVQEQHLEHRRWLGPAFLSLQDRVFAAPCRHASIKLQYATSMAILDGIREISSTFTLG